jgi:hypothetical protein
MFLDLLIGLGPDVSRIATLNHLLTFRSQIRKDVGGVLYDEADRLKGPDRRAPVGEGNGSVWVHRLIFGVHSFILSLRTSLSGMKPAATCVK